MPIQELSGRDCPLTPLGLGVQFELPVFRYTSAYHWSQVKTTQRRGLYIAILFCLFTKSSELHLGVPLYEWTDSTWGRTAEIVSQKFTLLSFSVADRIEPIHVEAEQPVLLENGDIILRRMECFTGLEQAYPFLRKPAYLTSGAGVIRGASFEPDVLFYFQLKDTGDDQLRGLGITFDRFLDETRKAGKLFVWVALITASAVQNKMRIDRYVNILLAREFLMENWPERELLAGAKESKYCHVMEPSSDSWILDVEPLINIAINVERQPLRTVDLGRKGGAVDVVDLIITKREVTTLPLIRKETK